MEEGGAKEGKKVWGRCRWEDGACVGVKHLLVQRFVAAEQRNGRMEEGKRKISNGGKERSNKGGKEVEGRKEGGEQGR